MRIFWSWQSDNHQPSGRYFVRDVLKELARELNGVDAAEEAERPELEDAAADDDGAPDDARVEVDHDTLGIGGSPRIADTILGKIEECGVFVADVTPVGKAASGKLLPNPNVMIELGYAMRVMDLQRIVLVMNTAEGAALRHLPFDLRHWRAPVTYSLKRDSDDDRRAEVAAELKADLRGVIAPGLKFAAGVMRDARRKSVRMPELTVTFEDGKGGPFALRGTPSSLNAVSLEDVKAATPLLTLPPPPLSGAAGLAATLSSMPQMGGMLAKRPIEQWTRAEREEHNVKIGHYYEAHARYLADYADFVSLARRSIPVELVLGNDGTQPATHIDVEITFPDGIVLHDGDGGFPEEPKAPKPPAERTGADISVGRSPFEISSLRSPLAFIDPMTVDPVGRRVSFSFKDLKHHHSRTLGTFIVSFESAERVASFEAEYVITANEPLEPIRGTIVFEVTFEP